MAEHKLTPGPWLAPCGYGVSRFEVQGDGHRVAVVDRIDDARAISALPDLLEAACEAAAALDALLRQKPVLAGTVCGSTTLGNHRVQLNAAIAKATGSAA